MWVEGVARPSKCGEAGCCEKAKENPKEYEAFNTWLRRQEKNGKADKQNYKKMSSDQKEQMRKWWHEQKLVLKEQAYVAITTLSTTETVKGKMLPIARIAVELGNDWEGAIQHCKTCVRKGQKYWMVDVKRVRFNGVVATRQ